MKKLFLLITIISIFTSTGFSQEETLLEEGNVDHGGFGGPVVKFTSINNEFGLLVGGRGGWIINHTFIIGGGGYGLVNKIENYNDVFSSKPYINFGYGGLELEYIMHSDDLIHFSVYSLIGGGGVTYRDEFWNHDWHWDNSPYGNDVFFVFEPAFNVEMNVTSFFRLHAGVSYRLVSGVNYQELSNSDLSGVSGILTLKFGSF